MPETREFLPKSAPLRPAGRAAGALVLRATGAFGEISRLARMVLEHDDLILVIGQGWDAGPEASSRLIAALDALPHAAFAFGETIGGTGAAAVGRPACFPVDAAALIARPSDLGPVAIRASEAVRLGWPDFGPPDLVLDGAAPWALATALAVRGGEGLFVLGARSSRSQAPPGSMDSLQPEGLAWLAACALSWGPLGKPPAPLAERLWRRWTRELTGAGFDGLTPPGTDPR